MAKAELEKSLELRMDLPLIVPGRVDRPFESAYAEPGLFIPGTTLVEPSTKLR